jgi:hypothetical protein
MSKHVESFFKDLASGMSRRAAFRRLFGAIGGAAAAVFAGRRIAFGSPPPYASCEEYCRDNTQADAVYIQQCIAFSRQCPPGFCAVNYLCSSGNFGADAQCRGGGPNRPDSNWICAGPFFS